MSTCKICCNEITDLGCFGSCEVIPTGLTAAFSGVYLFNWEFNGGIRTFGVTLTAGDPINLPAGNVNEDALIRFKVYQPNGVQVGSDCFQAKVLPQYSTVQTSLPTPNQTCDDMFQFTTIIGQQAYTLPANLQGNTLSMFSRFAVEFGFMNLPENDFTVSPAAQNWVISGNTITFNSTNWPINQTVEVKIQAYV